MARNFLHWPRAATLVLCGSLALAALLAGGCSRPAGQGPRAKARQFAGVKLRIACPSEVARDAVVAHGRAWESSGGEIKTLLYDRITSAPPQADVWVVEASQLPRWASAGRLALLPAGLRDDPAVIWRGLLPLYRERLLTWDGIAYSLPLIGDAPLCFYRKDLLQQHKLKPPATWEEFADIAEFFYRHRGPRPAPLPPLPASMDDLDRLFYSVAAPYARRALDEVTADDRTTDTDLFAFHFDIKTGQPRITAPGFVHALQLLRRLQKYRPSGSSAEPWQAFRKGDAVLCLAECRRLANFQQQGSPVWDRVGICPVPGSRVYFDYATGKRIELGRDRLNRVSYRGAGALLMAVPRSSGQAEAAFALLAELGGASTSDQVVLEPRWGGGIVRQAQLDRDHWDSFRLDPVEERQFKPALRQTFQPGIRNPVVCLRVPEKLAFEKVLTAEVRKALQSPGSGDAAQFLKTVAQRWQVLIQPRAAEHLRDYRLSLGLSAR